MTDHELQLKAIALPPVRSHRQAESHQCAGQREGKEKGEVIESQASTEPLTIHIVRIHSAEAAIRPPRAGANPAREACRYSKSSAVLVSRPSW